MHGETAVVVAVVSNIVCAVLLVYNVAREQISERVLLSRFTRHFWVLRVCVIEFVRNIAISLPNTAALLGSDIPYSQSSGSFVSAARPRGGLTSSFDRQPVRAVYKSRTRRVPWSNPLYVTQTVHTTQPHTQQNDQGNQHRRVQALQQGSHPAHQGVHGDR